MGKRCPAYIYTENPRLFVCPALLTKVCIIVRTTNRCPHYEIVSVAVFITSRCGKIPSKKHTEFVLMLQQRWSKQRQDDVVCLPEG